MSEVTEILWSSHEDEQKSKKTQDWFWALGFIAVSITIAAVLLGNTLFGILILLAAFVLGTSVNHESEEVDYTLNTRGITVSGVLYPYKSLEAFRIDDTRPNKTVLILDTQKPLVPHLVITLPSTIDTNALQDYLLDYLPEEELYEPASHRIAGILGF